MRTMWSTVDWFRSKESERELACEWAYRKGMFNCKDYLDVFVFKYFYLWIALID